MKKTICLLLTTASLMTSINSVLAVPNDINFEITGNTLKVFGTLNEAEEKQVLLRVSKNTGYEISLDEDVVFIKQLSSNKDGSFEFLCELPENKQNKSSLSEFVAKEYKFDLGTLDDVDDFDSEVIMFCGEDFQNKVLTLLNEAKDKAKTDIESATTDVKEILQSSYQKTYVGAKKYEKYKTDSNIEAISRYFVKLPKLTSITELKPQLNEAAVITVLKEKASNSRELTEMLDNEESRDSLGIADSTALKSYDTFKDLCGVKIATDYANSNIASIEESKKQFELAVIANVLKSSVSSYQIKLLLSTNENILGIGAYKLSDAEYMKLSGIEIKSVSDVKTEIEKIIKDRTDSKKTSSSGGGGGGGGASVVSVSDATPNNSETASGATSNKEIFNDLGGFDWAKDSIEILYKKGIISGKGDGIYAPSDNVTREEFVKLILSSFEIGKEANKNSSFVDISDSDWFAGYVYAACNRGIISGVSENTFGVNSSIKREDVACIVYRALKSSNMIDENAEYECDFADESIISGYAKESVAYMKEKKIISGYPDGTFNPSGSLTRAEAAVVINKVVDYVSRFYKGGIN